MNANLVCLLIGVPAALIWMRGINRGVMLGLIFGWVRRADAPGRFWLCSAVYGVIACAFIASPVLGWMRGS
jgi:hypothetical protein